MKDSDLDAIFGPAVDPVTGLGWLYPYCVWPQREAENGDVEGQPSSGTPGKAPDLPTPGLPQPPRNPYRQKSLL